MAYSIRSANLEQDKDSILALWQDNLRLITEERFRWIYYLNPVQPVQCWMVGDEGKNESAGTLSLFPREIRCGARTTRSAIPGYFAVGKQHRVLGPALLLLRAATEACDQRRLEFTYGCPNKASEPVLTRLGHKKIGSIGVYAKPLRTEYLFRRRLPGFLASPIGKLANIPLRLISRDLYKPTKSYRLEEVDVFDSRIDDLWERTSGQFGIIGVRSSEYLNWRYKICPQKSYRLFQVLADDGRVVAYFISWPNGAIETISDFYFQDEESFDISLALYIREIRKRKMDSIVVTFFGASRVPQALRRHGFLTRTTEESVFVYGTPPEARDPQNWYLTEGETHY